MFFSKLARGLQSLPASMNAKAVIQNDRIGVNIAENELKPTGERP
jgi:hypothetical protein